MVKDIVRLMVILFLYHLLTIDAFHPNLAKGIYSRKTSKFSSKDHLDLWIPKTSSIETTEIRSLLRIEDKAFLQIIRQFFSTCFLPIGKLSEDYFIYIRWRALQRYISATNNVFGTQALMLALGITKNKIGTTMATTWILKDVLGKISRVIWASKFGKKFDESAKRWRFRSSVLYAIGNGLELLTYIFPSLFIFTATIANALKQVSMLTSSATRNSIYQSFSSSNENIGDITAKGEAQGAIIDILGMATGIIVSEYIIRKRLLCLMVYSSLVLADIICVYQEIKSVVYKTFNFERAYLAVSEVLKGNHDNCGPKDVSLRERMFFPAHLDERVISNLLWAKQHHESTVYTKVQELRETKDRFMVFLKVSKRMRWLKWEIDITPRIVLRNDAGPLDLLSAVMVVCYCKVETANIKKETAITNFDEISCQILENSYEQYRKNHDMILDQLELKGWDLKKFFYTNKE